MRRWLRPLPIGATGLGGLIGVALAAEPVGIVVGLVTGAAGGLLADRVVRRPRPPRIDPFTLGEPWRRPVQDAVQARARFTEAHGRVGAGPIRDRLIEIGERISEAVDAVWRVAGHGQAMSDARRRIDVRAVTADVEVLRAENPDDHGPTIEALDAQLATAARLDEVIDETRNRLRLLNARLDEAVARSLELSSRNDRHALDPVDDVVEDVADDLEALRLALDEADGIGGPAA